jgi:hypothetical protein
MMPYWPFVEIENTMQPFDQRTEQQGRFTSHYDCGDPKSVWKVQDGAIWCSGNPVGLLRTKQEYSDFKLTLEWRWPEKPGYIGLQSEGSPIMFRNIKLTPLR